MTFSAYLKLSIRELFAFRVSFLVEVITKFLDLSLFLLFWWVVFSTNSSIGDWSIYDILILLSLSELYMSIFSLFFVGYFVLPMYVVNGRLDNLLVLPVSPGKALIGDQLQASRFARLLLAILLFLTSIVLHPNLSPGLLLLGFFFSGVGLLLNNLLLASLNLLSFWVGKMGYFIQAISVTDDALFFPLSKTEGIVRLVLSLILPIYFVSTFPTEIITNKLHFQELVVGSLVLLLLSTLWMVVFRSLWLAGLRRYQSAGSL